MSRLRLSRSKAEEHAISAESKLLWAEYYGPMQQAATALNLAIANTQNMMATIIATREGLEPSEWMFDIGRLVMVKKPKE